MAVAGSFPEGVDRVDPGRESASGRGDGWGTALVKSVVILVLSVVGFGVVPDRLVSYLSLHMSPTGRDLLVSLWVLVFFVFLCVLFVRFQRPRAPR